MRNFGFGLMRLPLSDPQDMSKVDVEKVGKMADMFMKKGFTYFDTSYVYHNGASETAFREAVVKRYPREAFTITDKLPMFMINDEKQLEPIFNETLERLGVDYLDYYLLHALSADTYATSEKVHAFDFVAKKQAEGKIRHIGFSFHDKADVLEEILKNHPEMEFVQLQINYLDWEDETVQAKKNYELCEKYGRKVFVMEPIKGGALINLPKEAGDMLKECSPQVSEASWAIRFAASLKNVVMVLSGMSDESQMADNLSFMENFKPLSEKEMAVLEKAAGVIRATIAVPCTACHYCDGCPFDIAIPDYFSIYNNLKRFGESQLMVASTYYQTIAAHKGKASQCIACGRCEQHCPQHINIIEELKKVTEEIENADI